MTKSDMRLFVSSLFRRPTKKWEVIEVTMRRGYITTFLGATHTAAAYSKSLVEMLFVDIFIVAVLIGLYMAARGR